MTRRLSALALAAAVSLTFAACGSDKKGETHEGETEGIQVTVGDLQYQVQMSRVLNPAEVEGWADGDLRRLDREAEVGFARALRRACSAEVRTKQTLLDDAQGWFFPDQDKLRVAKEYQMINCQRLDRLGISR